MQVECDIIYRRDKEFKILQKMTGDCRYVVAPGRSNDATCEPQIQVFISKNLFNRNLELYFLNLFIVVNLDLNLFNFIGVRIHNL